jgi:hypothetical protein
MPAAKKKPKKIFMPCDFGDRKTRREYRKPGPVIIYKKVEAFDEMGEVLALKELLALPVDQAKEVMLELSKTISDQKLAEAWSTHFTLVRKLRSILGIHKNHSGTIVNVTDIQGDKWPPAFRLSSRRAGGRTGGRTEKVVVMQNAVDERTAVPQSGVSGLTLSIRGSFSGAELGPRIEAISTLLSNCTGSRYTIDLSLNEVILAGATAGVAVGVPADGGVSAAAGVSAAGAESCYEERQAAR